MHSIHREQIQRERCEILSTLLLLYELPSSLAGDIRCSGHRVLELVKLIGGAVFSPQAVASADTAGDGFTPGSVAAEAEQLACLLLLRVLDIPSYIALTSAAPAPGWGAPTSLDDLVPLGGKVRCFIAVWVDEG